MLGRVLDMIIAQTARLGYRDDAILRDYAYSDVWVPSGGTRVVPLVAFTQTPPSYRSAAFAFTEGAAESPGIVVEGIERWARRCSSSLRAKWCRRGRFMRAAPRGLSIASRSIACPSDFRSTVTTGCSDAIYRAKSIGRIEKDYQLAFVDIGLIPAIEGEIQTKLDRLIREAVTDLRRVTNNQAMRLLFRGVFWLLAAKILTDRRNERAQSWNADRVADVLSSMGEFYKLGNDTQIWPARTLALLTPVWAAFRAGFNVANISADDLSYVYESTLVTPQARAQFGTHSTPRHVADYILDRFRLWEFGATPPTVYEPFAGAGRILRLSFAPDARRPAP